MSQSRRLYVLVALLTCMGLADSAMARGQRLSGLPSLLSFIIKL